MLASEGLFSFRIDAVAFCGFYYMPGAGCDGLLTPVNFSPLIAVTL
jgi:hypothetical protein